jgi:hypothetical protein
MGFKRDAEYEYSLRFAYFFTSCYFVEVGLSAMTCVPIRPPRL